MPFRCICGVRYFSDREPQQPPKASRGLGDTIANVTHFFRIEPCDGCEIRREALNEMFPYSPEYLAEQEQQAKERET